MEPALPTRSVGGGFMSPSMGKAVDDIEMGRKTVWADMGSTALDPSEGQLNERVAVKDGEFGELSPEIRTTVDETSDRAGIHPRRSSWGRKSGIVTEYGIALIPCLKFMEILDRARKIDKR